MSQKPLNKICIVVDCLSKGGAEKVAGILSKILIEKAFDVSIVSLRDDITYPYSGTLINIGKNHSKNKFIKQFQKTVRLKKNIKLLNPDIIIDFRIRNRFLMEFILYAFIWKSRKMIYTFHSYNIHLHLPKAGMFLKFYKKGRIVAVSNKIKKILNQSYGFSDVTFIPNTIDFERIEKLSKRKSINERYIIAIGSLRNEVKQFDKLIEVFNETNLVEKNIKLYILGDGPDKHNLEKLIGELKLQDHVKLLGFVENPYPYIKDAMFKVLCSKFEGFPMIILEALALNTPVVSFDCNSGPSEMISHNKNGILVPDQDFEALKTSIDYLVNNKSILSSFRNNTDDNFELYSEENHFKKWKPLLK